MKKLLLLLSLFIGSNLLFAGGIVTNTNQSTAWVRMMIRDASTEIDAVYYNPAGLTKLSDGLHFYLSNQTIIQSRKINNSVLKKEYEGGVFAPVFPNFYAAYKTGKVAFSLGFAPIGGGGSATFDEGVPMIYLPVAALANQLSKKTDVNGYSLDANFTGSSIYFGVQAGVTYQINDMISVYGGLRYVWVDNKNEGKMENIMFRMNSSDPVPAPTFLKGVANQSKIGAQHASQAASSMQPLVDAFGDKTFAELEGIVPDSKLKPLKMGLAALNQSPDNMTMKQAQAVFSGAVGELNKQAAKLEVAAQLMGGQEADVKQKGSGISPILGLNLSLMEEKLNIGVKYEFQTNIELTNETPVGKGFTIGFDQTTGKPIEMFPDGAKTNSDIPALLSIGASYEVTDDLKLHVGYHNFFDKNVGWLKNNQGKEVVDNNSWELGLGIEYQLTDNFLLSAGYLRGQTGANNNYFDDTRLSLNSDTYGFGGAYKLNDMITLEAGVFYAIYPEKTISYEAGYTQTYDKDNLGLSAGITFNLGKKK